MRKSGLHKQISSIFDGVTVPQNGNLQSDAEPLDESTAPNLQDVTSSDLEQEMTPVPQQTGSTLLKRMHSGPSEECAPAPVETPAPVVQVGRPMPLPKTKAMSKTDKGPGVGSQVKKAVFGSQSSLDPRQKKAAMLVGILSVVFGVVMFVSLGGVGQTQAVAADVSTDAQATLPVVKKKAQEWKTPQPLPEDLRNAAVPVSKPIVEQQTASTTTAAADTSQWVVKGILFSKTNPSAIINDQILSEGETLDGITVVKITKENVEFEADGKQWTQTVQR